MCTSKFIAFLVLSFAVHVAYAEELKLFSENVTPVEVKYTEAQIIPFALGQAQSRSLPELPKPIFIGEPLIQTKGIVRGEGFLYVADTGQDSAHNEPAKIWKLNPDTKELKLFYSGPLLTHAKWLYFRRATEANTAELFISDYGEEPTPRSPGTGVGAKVLAATIDSNGDLKTIRVLYGGPPLRSPEGITVVGDTVVLADWAAGPNIEMPDRPGKFNSGKVFLIPALGGAPVEAFPDHRWVTLIGACRYVGEDGKAYIRFVDIDSGRPQGTIKYLPQSGTVEFYRSEIITERPLKLGALERIVIQEKVPLSVSVNNMHAEDSYQLELKGGAVSIDGKKMISYDSSNLTPDKTLNLTILSDSSEPDIKIEAVTIRNGIAIEKQKLVATKQITPDYSPMADNKHGGAVQASLGGPRLIATADGTTQGLYLIPANGGVPSTVWRGKPFSQPMGTQYSWDESKLFMTDQDAGPNGTAAVFELAVPSLKERFELYPNLVNQHPFSPPLGYTYPLEDSPSTQGKK